jgi:hypothetical protein
MRRIVVALVTAASAVLTAHAAWTPEVDAALGRATYVYVQSERKTGEWSKPAEIWFYVEQGKLYVGTRPTSWRVKRATAGRTRARIAVGSVDGPTFEATAAIVKDPAVADRMMEAYAKKYPEGWKKYEQGFREGFKTGERVLVRYTPK